MDVAEVQDRDGCARWLRSHDADCFVDSAVLGDLAAWEADELLAEYGMPATPENLSWLRREIDAAICEGC